MNRQQIRNVLVWNWTRRCVKMMEPSSFRQVILISVICEPNQQSRVWCDSTSFWSVVTGLLSMNLGVRKFKCDVCSKEFRKKSSLLCHTRTIHVSDSERRRPVECEEWGQTFTENGSLTVHLRVVHRGEKRYSCDWQVGKRIKCQN